MINLRHLPNQQRDECMQIFLRRHWIVVIKLLLYSLMLLAVPVAILAAFNVSGINIFNSFLGGSIAGLLISVYLITVLLITMTQFTDYYLDTWIVTNERVINIEQNGLFSRAVSELHLNQIQDVTSETIGFLATFLTYGDVYIQTAGEKERFRFEQINNPDDVKTHILRLVDEDKSRHGDASIMHTAPH
jgi:hypothetical protein